MRFDGECGARVGTAFAIIFFGLVIASVVFGREATNEVHAAISCTSSTGEALAVNGGRISALFVNDGTSTIWIAINQAAVANEGIRLNANGGSYYINDADGNLDREAINCITASATVILLVTEWYN